MGTGLFELIAQGCQSLAATAAPSITAMGVHIVLALATIMMVWFGVQEALASVGKLIPGQNASRAQLMMLRAGYQSPNAMQMIRGVKVLLPILSLLIFGGSTLKDFAFALLIGVGCGGETEREQSERGQPANWARQALHAVAFQPRTLPSR